MNDERLRPGQIALKRAQQKALAAEKSAAFAKKRHLWALQELQRAKEIHAASMHHIKMEAYYKEQKMRRSRMRRSRDRRVPLRSPKVTGFEDSTFLRGPKETPIKLTRAARLRIQVCFYVCGCAVCRETFW